MFLDARDLEDGTTLSAAVCIAGAGAAGITLALALRDSGLSVLVLESGGYKPEPKTQELYEGKMLGIDTWGLADMRVRTLGGTTDHWSGFCRPLSSDDFEPRDWMESSGWPITREQLDPFYERAQESLQVGQLDYDAKARSLASGKPLLAFSLGAESRYYQLSPPTRFAKVYRPALQDAEDVRVVLHANVLNIATMSAGSQVSRFECQTLSGVNFVAEATRYVLALGGIENARLLLASNEQARDGVANGHDVVGRYFMEHPHYLSSAVLAHGLTPDLSFYTSHTSDLLRKDGRKVPILGTISLSTELRVEEELLNCSATLVPKDVKTAATGDIGSALIEPLVSRDYAELGVHRLSVRCEQSPLEASRVTLGKDHDALGMPRVELDWRVAPEDEERTLKTVSWFARELSLLNAGRMWIPRNGERFSWTTQPGGHHMGTTRMGTDPKTSVVDENCRCHEVDNLFIVGSSVFPTGGDANPTLTITALAHRLADHLRESR